ncbi:hypothetical protein LLG95_08515 [bacterium]|nr:hypothetical protein [bacterium]
MTLTDVKTSTNCASWLDRFTSNRTFYWIFAVLIVIKLALAPIHPEPAAPDEGTYITVAQRLLDQHVYTNAYNQPSAGIMPGYPLMMAAVLAVSGGSAMPMYFVNVLLSIAIAWAAGALLFLLTGNRSLSRLCALLVFVFPPVVTYAWHPLTEIPYTAALMMLLVFWERTRQQPLVISNWLFLGLFTVTSFMIRPVMFLLTPVYFAWPLIVARFQWRSIAGAAVGTAVVLALWLPWVYRNYKIFGGFVPLATTSGQAFFTGTLTDWEKWSEEQTAEMERSGVSLATHNEFEVSKHFAAVAKQNIARDRAAYFTRIVKNSWKLWPTAYSGRYYPKGVRTYAREGNWPAVAVKTVLGGINLAMLAGLACAMMIFLGQPKWWPYVLIIVYFHVMHAAIMPMPRYSFPLTPMILAMILGAVDQIRGSRGCLLGKLRHV